MKIKRYRKKPVVIYALKYDGKNAKDVVDFMGCQYPFIKNKKIMIGTLEGEMSAGVGDWIIKGIAGEFYPCKPDIFEKTYELVEGE